MSRPSPKVPPMRWRSSRLCIDQQMYAEQCQLVNDMLKRAKSSYYSSIISHNTSNQKLLFNTIENLLHRRPEKRYPTAASTAELANNFAEFFHNKIVNIQNALSRYLIPIIGFVWLMNRHHASLQSSNECL